MQYTLALSSGRNLYNIWALHTERFVCLGITELRIERHFGKWDGGLAGVVADGIVTGVRAP